MKALITGASSGIGKEMAIELANRGWDLILVARRVDRLETLKGELGKVDVRCMYCDVSKEEECLRLYEETKNENVDMLINNAGFGAFGYFDEVELERDLRLVDTNVRGVHILTKLFLQDFVKRDSGYILNTGSIAGFMIGPLLSSYYASKHYVVTLTEAIAEELRRKKSKVRISVLCPGPVSTEFNEVARVKFLIKGHSPEFVASYAIKKALKGKVLIIPGIIVKMGVFMTRLVPRRLLARILYKFQKLKM